MASRVFTIVKPRRARKGPTMREVLLMHAVGRIAYRGWIDNVQVSWVKTGVRGAQQALQAGCNDLGGTLMDENISRAAGASHGQDDRARGARGMGSSGESRCTRRAPRDDLSRCARGHWDP
mgnify:CR=1 FL=1